MMQSITSLGFSLVLAGVIGNLVPAGSQHVQRQPASGICSYLPLRIGNSWTYSSRGGIGENRSVWYGYEQLITDSVRDADGSLLFACKDYFNGDHRPRPVDEYYSCRGGVIYYSFALHGSRPTPKHGAMVPILRLPLKVGNAWQFVYNDTTITNYTIASIEPSTFNGNRIDTVLLVVAVSNWGTDSSWYGRGIGLLKRRRDSRLKDTSHYLNSTTTLWKYHIE